MRHSVHGAGPAADEARLSSVGEGAGAFDATGAETDVANLAVGRARLTILTSAGRRAAAAGFTAAALILVTTACSGSRADKAGGEQKATPVTLTLATADSPDSEPAAFVAAVQRLSGGSIRIEVANDRRYGEIESERLTAEDVRAGVVDLGVVGARAWDTLEVKSFRALVAPFLVDSLALERRVLEGSIGARMLEAFDSSGLVGLAVVPGALRRPVGVSRPLLGPGSYRAAWVGVRPGRVAEATFRALGAEPKGYNPGSIRHLVGAEVDLTTVAASQYDQQARAVTANVVFWPSAGTIVMNRDAYGALPEAQQDLLRRAGREALGPAFASIESDESGALETICESRHLSLVTADAAGLAALRRAVRPVYDALERDPLTRELIAGIREMRADGLAAARESVRCPGVGSRGKTGTSDLEGLWEQTLTREELLDAGASRGYAQVFRGRRTVAFRAGRFESRVARRGVFTGTYRVDGGVVQWEVEACRPYWICSPGVGPDEFLPGHANWARWSVYRDILRFARIPGRPAPVETGVKSLTRVR